MGRGELENRGLSLLILESESTVQRKRIPKKNATASKERAKLPLSTVTLVLTEAGYRCAVPTCRGILALDMHHIWEVSAGGGDDLANLVALCPTCHALYHRGTISPEAIYSYKSLLVSLGQAFDLEAIDRLLFLSICPPDYLVLSGDGVLHFARLIAANLVIVEQKANNAWQLVTYAVNISPKGRMLIDAWKSGDRTAISSALETSQVALLQEEIKASEQRGRAFAFFNG